MSTGFSVLIWVKPDSSMISALTEDSAERMKRCLLSDACTLLSVRWSMDVAVISNGNQIYAYGVNTRFNVAERTIRNALGDLCEHVDLLRGTSHNTSDELVNFKECKEKWNVPEMVSDTSSGWGEQAQETTFRLNKRRH